MLCFMSENISAWSVSSRGDWFCSGQPLATARPTRPPPAPSSNLVTQSQSQQALLYIPRSGWADSSLEFVKGVGEPQGQTEKKKESK